MTDRIIQVGDDAYGNGTFGPIPVGTKLRVSVFDIEETVTGPNAKNPGSPQFVFTAKVLDDFPFTYVDPDSGEESEQNAKGREIRYNYITLDPKAAGAWALVAFAEAVGWKTEKGKGVSVPVNLKEVQGTEFLAKIGQNKGQDGKMYNRVTGYAKVNPGTPVTPVTQSWETV